MSSGATGSVAVLQTPGVIRARILQSADDLGEAGTDPYYGKGRINLARALVIIH